MPFLLISHVKLCFMEPERVSGILFHSHSSPLPLQGDGEEGARFPVHLFLSHTNQNPSNILLGSLVNFYLKTGWLNREV